MVEQFYVNTGLGSVPPREEILDENLIEDGRMQEMPSALSFDPVKKRPVAPEKTAEDYQADPLFQQSLVLSKKLMGEGTPFNPALASLLYFTKMGELASKKGSSVFGSIAGAGVAPAAYLMQKEKEKAARDANVNKTAISLYTAASKDKKPSSSKMYSSKVSIPGVVKAGEGIRLTEKDLQALSPEAQNQLFEFKDPKIASIKSVGSGTLAKYFSEENAKLFVQSQGVAEDSDNYNNLVEKFTAPSSEMVNKPIIEGGMYLEAVPLVKNGNVINLQLTPSKSPVKPYFTEYVNKRIPVIAKAVNEYNSTAREVLPRVREAMNLLKSGRATTGAIQEKTLQTKRLFAGAFGINDPEIVAMETLQSTSNFIAPKMRPKGSGSTSDMEFKAYQRASLDIGNSPKANYISLYSFEKMAENAFILNQKETELLTSGKYDNMTSINRELNKFDKGIFEKYRGDIEDDDAIQSWLQSLPDGAVFLNNGLINVPDPYIIKGWGK